MGKVGLASQRAEAGELGNLHVDQVVPAGLGIGEGLEGFSGATGHGVLNLDEEVI